MSVTSEAAANSTPANATPAKSSRMAKAQQTDEAAWALINDEAAAREAKTRALRAARLEREAAQQDEEPAAQARKTTARKMTVRRSRQK